MKQGTLVFLIDKKAKKVCLGMKKRGFGVGRWNGFGGKPNQGESIREAAIRELWEESTVIVADNNLHQQCLFVFKFQDNPSIDMEVTVFTATNWQGEPTETEEMKPEWFDFDKIPFNEMWVDDVYWLPRMLAGEKLEGEFLFGEADSVLNFALLGKD